MLGSSLASAASVMFFLSFSTTSTLPANKPLGMALSLTTAEASVTSEKNQSARDKSTPATPSSEAQASPAAHEDDPLKQPLPAKKKKFGKLSKESSAYNK